MMTPPPLTLVFTFMPFTSLRHAAGRVRLRDNADAGASMVFADLRTAISVDPPPAGGR
jgi:hypothetical protein